MLCRLSASPLRWSGHSKTYKDGYDGECSGPGDKEPNGAINHPAINCCGGQTEIEQKDRELHKARSQGEEYFGEPDTEEDGPEVVKWDLKDVQAPAIFGRNACVDGQADA